MCANIAIYSYLKNAYPPNYSKTPTYHVQGTTEKLGSTINQFQKNRPALISMYTSNNATNFQQLKRNSNPLSYGDPNLDKRLIP